MKRKKKRSKEQWKRAKKREAKQRTLTAIEHEEKESSSQKRRTQRALGKECCSVLQGRKEHWEKSIGKRVLQCVATLAKSIGKRGHAKSIGKRGHGKTLTAMENE